MGNIKCSCVKNNENNQIVFDNKNVNQNNFYQNNSLFEIIKKHYKSDNIEVQQINKKEFNEMINSDINIIKILEEYEQIFDKYNISFIFDYNNKVEQIKFIDNNNNAETYYFGEFNESGIIDGIGIKILSRNQIYKGEFSNGIYNGKGLFIKNKASIFGDWENGEINGNVLYKIEDQFEYIGNFENNKKNGFGTEKYPDGSNYEGNYINNKKNGLGIYTFPNNEYYEGNFEDDLYNGQGQYIWGNNGNKYIGEFKNGKIEGKGTFSYEDGTIFVGNFIEGYKNGEGYIQFPDGKKYFGNWLNGELYGYGYLLDGNKKIEIIFRHGKIISKTINEDIEENINNLNNNENITKENNVSRFDANSFYGDQNKININKYICLNCKLFFLQPLKCSVCNIDYCEKCIKDKKCLRCKNDKFIDDYELLNEMKENLKIKCNKCKQILKYEDSFMHFH